MLLSRVRLEHDPGASYGKFTGLDSPDHARYIPKMDVKGLETKRYSLISQSSDSISFSPSSDWKPSQASHPSYSMVQPRSLSNLYAVNVASDSPVGSPERSFDLSRKWTSDSPEAPSTSASKIYKPITMWSTVSPSSASVSSSENTQTLSWARTPFKATQLPSSQKENRPSNLYLLDSTGKTPSMSYMTAGRGKMTFSPVSAASSPFSMTAPQDSLKQALPSPQGILQPLGSQRSPSTHIGCLVDLNDSYAELVSPSNDETTKTIRLELQREMESLGTGMLGGQTCDLPLLPTVSSGSDVVPSEAAQSGEQVSGLVKMDESTSPARSVTSASGETTELLFPTGVPLAEAEEAAQDSSQRPESALESEEETWCDAKVAESILRFLCDDETKAASWLSSFRAAYSFDSLCSILVQLHKVGSDDLHVLEASLVHLLERGLAEAVDVQDCDEHGQVTVTRLFRASLASFERFR
jgi:hypothetical protein